MQQGRLHQGLHNTALTFTKAHSILYTLLPKIVNQPCDKLLEAIAFSIPECETASRNHAVVSLSG